MINNFAVNAMEIAGNPVPQRSNMVSMILMLAAFSFMFYFMIIRPQHKRAKAHKNLIESIVKGDEVITNGGLVGRVVRISKEGYIFISLNDTTEVIIKRDFITTVLPKGTIKSL